jgi:hypothetical protein
MEVHHHPHAGKGFKAYFLEFLMLFLAVFLGFVAENIREHYVEGIRGKEYAHALLIDLTKDTAELNTTVNQYHKNIATIDTLLELKQNDKDLPGGALYYYASPALTAFRISFNDATLQQLKSSGNLRYFRNIKLKEMISAYDNAIRSYSLRQDFELISATAINEYSKMFDYEIKDLLSKNRNNPSFVDSFTKTNPPLLINDPVSIKQFLGFCYSRRNNWKSRIENNIQPILVIAGELIEMLKKEYRF